MSKIIVVGSGFSGSVIARRIAEELDKPVTVLEKRHHIGGNMYDEYDEYGILVQKYGPHFLHTNNYQVIAFLQQYAQIFPYFVKLLSFIDGRYVRLPFNFLTVQQLIGPQNAQSLLTKLRAEFQGRNRVPVLELAKHADKEISAYGTMLFEKAYRTYVSKMWGIQPEQIDRSVLDRVPMAMSYEERYLNKDFQYLPVHGFSKLFENMLDHPQIDICLNTDALDHLELDKNLIRFDGRIVDCVIFTGAVDELFRFKYGRLPYRSLDIHYQHHMSDNVLPSEIVSYPQADGYTRSTEYRKIMFDNSEASGSTVATEYPVDYNPAAAIGNIPFYPVITAKSKEQYHLYLQDAQQYKNLFLCGRLAEFKYYNMDVCIEHALQCFENIRTYLDSRKEQTK